MISIVLPAFNEQKYIKRCLDSLKHQKTKRIFEIVVVDNNSSDKTAEIVTLYLKKLPLRLVHESSQGIDAARTRGFDEARGDIIARIDADCIAPEDWIEKIGANFDNKIDGLCGNFNYYDAPWIITTIMKFFHFISMRTLLGHEVMLGYNCALRKKMWVKIRPLVIKKHVQMHEDILLGTYIHKNGILHLDMNLVMNTSIRRLYKNFYSFTVAYPIMCLKNILFARFYDYYLRKNLFDLAE